MKTFPKMEWISVKDRLPENHQEVLFIYSDKHGVTLLTGWYDEENHEWVSSITGFLRDISEKAFDDCHFKPNRVKYWMPLPEVGKE